MIRTRALLPYFPLGIFFLQYLALSTVSIIARVKVLPHCTGTKSGRSFLIEDGALPWIVQNANNEASSIRRHIELALCHLAQHGMYQVHCVCKLATKLSLKHVP